MCSKITCLKATTCQKRYCSILLNTRKNVKKKGKVLHLLQVMGGGDCSKCDDACRQQNGRQLCCLVSEQGRKFERVTDVATCLMARDYKGFGNQATNGVIVWKKK